MFLFAAVYAFIFLEIIELTHRLIFEYLVHVMSCSYNQIGDSETDVDFIIGGYHTKVK